MSTTVTYLRLFKFLALAIALALSSVASTEPAVGAAVRVSSTTLTRALGERRDRVPEFRFIRQEAKRLGVKIYLFGGTAAGFAHYVKEDLQRESGDTRFQKERFDYDFTSIYRSTQDLDIVVDGTPAQAEELQKRLIEMFPHFQGNKEQWEVRLLRQTVGDKLALLGNPDFLNQHTDSNSTGMVDLTATSESEIVKDLRDWSSRSPQFLRDVLEGKIHFYFSPLHQTTSRFKEKKNPPILSVVRFFTKAFQYDLDMRAEDLEILNKMIADFDPKKVGDTYAASWLEKNGPKLFRHAVDIESAWNRLEENGLRKKLIAIGKNPAQQDSLAWWMSKEPLRTKSVGAGKGKTAAELGIDVVAHETNSFLSYESITRSSKGEPNALISRQNKVGEVAVHGDGFYTRTGRVGAAGTGLTIRFRVDPRARVGTDFHFVGEPGSDGYAVFHNKAALQVIPESIDVGMLDYFELLGKIDRSERGVLLKLKRKISNRFRVLPEDEKTKVLRFIEKRILELKRGTYSDPVLDEWLEMSIATDYPEVIRILLARGDLSGSLVTRFLARQPPSPLAFEVAEALAKSSNTNLAELIMTISRPDWVEHPSYIPLLKKILPPTELPNHASNLMATLTTKFAGLMQKEEYTFLIEWLIEKSNSKFARDKLYFDVFSKKPRLDDPRLLTWVKSIVAKEGGRESLIFFADQVVRKVSTDRAELMDYLVQEASAAHNRFTRSGDQATLELLLEDKWKSHPSYSRWVAKLTAKSSELETIAETFSKSLDGPALRAHADSLPRLVGMASMEKAMAIVSAYETAYERLGGDTKLQSPTLLKERLVERADAHWNDSKSFDLTASAKVFIRYGAMTPARAEKIASAIDLRTTWIIPMLVEWKISTPATRQILFRKLVQARDEAPWELHFLKGDPTREGLIKILEGTAPSEPLASDVALLLRHVNKGGNVLDMDGGHLPAIERQASSALDLKTRYCVGIGGSPRGVEFLVDFEAGKFFSLSDAELETLWRTTKIVLDDAKKNGMKGIELPQTMRMFAVSKLSANAEFRTELLQRNREWNPNSMVEIEALVTTIAKPTRETIAATLKLIQPSVARNEVVFNFLERVGEKKRVDVTGLLKDLKASPSDITTSGTMYFEPYIKWLLRTRLRTKERHQLIKDFSRHEIYNFSVAEYLRYAFDEEVATFDRAWVDEMIEKFRAAQPVWPAARHS